MCVGLIETDRLIRSRGRRRRQRRRAVRRADRPRRDRRRVGAGAVPSSTSPRTSARPCRSATRSRRRSCSSARWSCSSAGCSSRCRTSARRASRPPRRDGVQGRGRDRPARAPRPAARGGHGAVRDHGLGVPGADAVRRRAGARCRRCWPSARAGRSTRTAIGEVTDTRRLRVFDGDALVGDMPVEALVDECPAYDLEPAEPATPLYPAPARMLVSDDPGEIAARRCSAPRTSPRAAGRSSSTTRSSARAPCAARSRPTPRSCCSSRRGENAAARPAIAVAIDGNGRRVAADPYRGAVEAVLECSANLACVGAEPLGLTNCLNFGNPEKPHIAWQLTRAVAGLGDACRAFGIPVVGGNVSLYNEGAEGPIYPTPVVGLVGELPDAARAGPARLRGAGRRDRADRRRLLGAVARRLGAVEAARRAGRGPAPRGRPRRAARRCTPRSARPSAPARCTPPTTSPRAASPSRSPSARSRPASARRSRVSTISSPRARAPSSSPARPRP